MNTLCTVNPKLGTGSTSGRAKWFPYYAGFSETFAAHIVSDAKLEAGSVLLDPWNGSGTSTSVAAEHGLRATGYDLNPAMVIPARSRCIPSTELTSLRSLLRNVMRCARNAKSYRHVEDDPLLDWMSPSCVRAVRTIELSITNLLVDERWPHDDTPVVPVEQLSSICCFFYLGLFRMLNDVLRRFHTRNPTWVSTPKDALSRFEAQPDTILEAFDSTVSELLAAKSFDSNHAKWPEYPPAIGVASSTNLPLGNDSIDLVITSPPYCTRIDYAVATKIELALLGYGRTTGFDALRRSMLGSTTVPSVVPPMENRWGPTCTAFLNGIRQHKSKASSTYYYKNHVQYYSAIFQSLNELCRVLRPRATAVLVVQDSYYKDLWNDLPQMFIEMSRELGFLAYVAGSFPTKRLMVNVNTRARAYRPTAFAKESIIVLTKAEET